MSEAGTLRCDDASPAPPVDGQAWDAGDDGPVGQSLRIGFRALTVAIGLLACFWAASNLRQVPPDTQAVVLRFGAVVGVQQAGLVLALPRPIDQVMLLPGPSRQLALPFPPAPPPGDALIDPASRAAGQAIPPGAGSYLTGDGGVVLLDGAMTWRVRDAAAYFVQSAHVTPALQRLFVASAIAVAAGRTLDDFMVVHSARLPVDVRRGPAADVQQAAQAQRQALNGDLVREINRRIGGLRATSVDLGVEVTRVDATALLSPSARLAFEAVLEATQMADQGLAAARTDATRRLQQANQDRDGILADAHAAAAERIGTANTKVAAIMALEHHMDPAGRPSLLDQTYRERIAAVLRQAGSVNTVDRREGGRLILPGAQP